MGGPEEEFHHLRGIWKKPAKFINTNL